MKYSFTNEKYVVFYEKYLYQDNYRRTFLNGEDFLNYSQDLQNLKTITEYYENGNMKKNFKKLDYNIIYTEYSENGKEIYIFETGHGSSYSIYNENDKLINEKLGSKKEKELIKHYEEMFENYMTNIKKDIRFAMDIPEDYKIGTHKEASINL